MSTERSHWDRTESLFHAALEVEAHQREEFLNRECSVPSVRAEVNALLAAHESHSPGFDDLGEESGPGAVPGGRALQPGRTLGRYRIIRVIGEGGSGIVYEAAQDSPARSLALKVLSSAAGTGRRFEREASMLARLRHPGIARIYDAGVLDIDGRAAPCIAMELVPDARTIIRHAEERALDTRARLALFVRICEAVQHAHSQGIIHRDLKPANILVDAAGNPQIIDFGVATVTDADIRTTRATSMGQIVGTVAYMSPEQCAGDPREIDTRSDVYALGVILFELLTGRLPHEVRSKLLHEAVRAIREDEPTRLSTVNLRFRGDLDTIVGKSLARDKDRRYQSASALAADVSRFLADQPIDARAPSAAYHLSKFARRHRPLVAAAGAALGILIAALIALSAMYLSAEQARRQAVESRDAATLEAEKAVAAVDFLVNMLTSADPKRTEGEKLTVRQVLDAASERVAEALKDKPEVRATIERALARTYSAIGNLRKSADHYARHIELLLPIEGESSLAVAASRQQRGFVLWQLGEMEAAAAELSKAISALDESTDERARLLCQALERRARIDYTGARYDAAIADLQRAVQIGERHLPHTRDALAQAEEMLAATLLEQGKTAESLAHFRRSVDLTQEVYGRDHVFTAGARANAAKAEMAAGNLSEADGLLADALRVIVKISGPDHRNAHAMKMMIGDLRSRQGRWQEAETLLTEAIAGFRVFYGKPAPDIFEALILLGHVQRRPERVDQAIETWREAVSVGKAALRPEHPKVVEAAGTLSELLAERAAGSR